MQCVAGKTSFAIVSFLVRKHQLEFVYMLLAQSFGLHPLLHQSLR